MQTVNRVDQRQQAVGQAGWNALNAQNYAGAKVFKDGGAVDELSFHVFCRASSKNP